MEIGKKYNTLTLEEYFFYIDNYKQYKDFNTLGLYRSIVEHENLSLAEKISVREHAHKTLLKTFQFLQLKDPKTYVEVAYLGEALTQADEQRIWDDIRRNQQRILDDKKIKHRNFGDYSKHNCGYESCIWNGIMVKQGSWLAQNNMHFDSDKNKYNQKSKSAKRKTDRKNEKQIINRAFDNE